MDASDGSIASQVALPAGVLGGVALTGGAAPSADGSFEALPGVAVTGTFGTLLLRDRATVWHSSERGRTVAGDAAGNVYVSSTEVVKLTPEGEVAWTWPVAADDPVVHQGIVVAACSTVELAATGLPAWHFVPTYGPWFVTSSYGKARVDVGGGRSAVSELRRGSAIYVWPAASLTP